LKEADGKARGIVGATKGKTRVAKDDPTKDATLSRAGQGGDGGGEARLPSIVCSNRWTLSFLDNVN